MSQSAYVGTLLAWFVEWGCLVAEEGGGVGGEKRICCKLSPSEWISYTTLYYDILSLPQHCCCIGVTKLAVLLVLFVRCGHSVWYCRCSLVVSRKRREEVEAACDPIYITQCYLIVSLSFVASVRGAAWARARKLEDGNCFP